MKYFYSLLFTLIILGCTSPPIPKDYDGPISIIRDSFDSISEKKAYFYVVNKIDGKKIEDSVMHTIEVNHGRGLKMSPFALRRQVPARELTLNLEATTHYAAPILALINKVYKVSGDIVFTPEVDEVYLVNGILNEEYAAVWIEDSSGVIVTEKIEKHTAK